MTLLWLCVGWVFASAVVAMLPIRNQFAPVAILFPAALVLIGWAALQVHWLAGLFALFAFVSMFRNPLRYVFAKLRGQNPELPE